MAAIVSVKSADRLALEGVLAQRVF